MRTVLLSLITTTALLTISAAWAIEPEEVKPEGAVVIEGQETIPPQPPADLPMRKRMMMRAQDREHPSTIDSEGGGAIPALPLASGNQGDIHYITGGIGDEEMAMLKQREREFNVQLMMAGTGGHYIGGAMVRVLGESGEELLSVNGAGPYFYVNLKPGKYTLEITARQGGIKKAAITVPASGTVKPVVRFTE